MSTIKWGHGTLYGQPEEPEPGREVSKPSEGSEWVWQCPECGKNLVGAQGLLRAMVSGHVLEHLRAAASAAGGLGSPAEIADHVQERLAKLSETSVPVKLVKGPDGVYRPEG